MVRGNGAELAKTGTKSSEKIFNNLAPIPDDHCPYVSCYDGSPHEPVPTGYCPSDWSLSDCYEADLYLYMGEDPALIDPAEFIELLFTISNDVHQSTPFTLVLGSTGFDTPFYDEGLYGYKQPGVGCLYGKCYARHELNYIAQGALWARVGLSKEQTYLIVWVWKLSPVMHYPTTPSPGTLEMTDIGYDTYMPTPPSP
jgi:hypothetical protein